MFLPSKPSKEKPPSLSQQALLSERSKKYDPNATAETCISDLRRIQEEHPDQFISRNFYRVHGKFSDGTWDQFFGTFEEFRKQAGLQLSRAQQQLEKHIAKHAALDVYRKFFDEEVKPWCGKYEKPFKDSKRMRLMVVASDFHDQEADQFCLSVFLDTCQRLQPDVIVLNGDVWDQYEFSRFDLDPRMVNIKQRYDFVRERIFEPLRKACPTAQIDLILGNHEFRLLKHLADRTPNMRVLMDLMGLTLSKLLLLDDFSINLVAKIDLAAYKSTDVRDQIKKNYKKYFETVVVNHAADEDFGMSSISGHVHRPGFKTKCNEVKGPIWHLTLGCMCKVDAEYHQAKINAQQSFGIIHIDTVTQQAVAEHVMFSDTMAVVGGVYYSRKQ